MTTCNDMTRPPFDARSAATVSRPYPETTTQLMDFADGFFRECKDIAQEKNKRYAKEADPFRNFRLAGQYGIAVRLSDKIARLLVLTEPGNVITDNGESIEDTCLDAANYCMLLCGLRMNERGGR